MTAKFELEGMHEPVLVLSPGSLDECILLAAYLGYDSNVLRFTVTRREDGQIQTVRVYAESAE